MSDDVARVAADVITERQRQIRQEGWSPEHDDEHTSGELAGAAACPKTQLPPEWPGVRGVRKTARAALRRKALVTQYVTLQTHVRDTQTRQHACGSTT